jgi:hypothetical protein
MPEEGFQIDVENFDLAPRAQRRIQEVLNVAIDWELALAGGADEPYFCKGSIKGLQ